MNLQFRYVSEFVAGSVGGLLSAIPMITVLSRTVLPADMIIKLTLANALATGVAGGSAKYLSSQADLYKGVKMTHTPTQSATATFLFYFFGTLIGLSIYIIDALFGLNFENRYIYSMMMVPILLYLIGSHHAQILGRPSVYHGLEVLMIGVFSASITYIIGSMIRNRMK